MIRVHVCDDHPRCRFHPDVSQDELAEAKFRGLREAYELLMGKGDPDRESRAPFGGNWEFHDWYELVKFVQYPHQLVAIAGLVATAGHPHNAPPTTAYGLQVLVVQHATEATKAEL